MEGQLKDIWDKYRIWIIGGIVVIVLILIFVVPNASDEPKSFKYSAPEQVEKSEVDPYTEALSQYHIDTDMTEAMSERSEVEPIAPINTYKNWSTKRDSTGERLCRQALQDIFGVPFPSIRPDWLKNVSGRNLEIDCYNDDLKLGCEYHGEQHFKRVKKWQTQEEFEAQQLRDQIKFEKCEELGIYLLVVPYTVPHKRIREYIEYYLPTNRLARLEMDMTE